MLSVYLVRAGLIATPFVVWFLWREWARRHGQEMGETPWTWLTAAAAVLFGVSLLVVPLFRHGPDRGRYTPAELQPDGSITPGQLEAP